MGRWITVPPASLDTVPFAVVRVVGRPGGTGRGAGVPVRNAAVTDEVIARAEAELIGCTRSAAHPQPSTRPALRPGPGVRSAGGGPVAG
ncbi:hypothetical protein ACIBEJ_34075 [Nonomuraea sp. NPDC050790]|uniref:hypothetical protein n=1 Tax=Nonomuraea sp. NPDC050790 TaxID=3364371 RepID=UPI0037B91709